MEICGILILMAMVIGITQWKEQDYGDRGVAAARREDARGCAVNAGAMTLVALLGILALIGLAIMGTGMK